MAALTLKTIVGGFADFLVSQLSANKASILAEITSKEGQLQALLVSALTSVKVGGPVLSVYIDPILESYASSVIAQYGPEVVYDFIVQEAGYAAKDIGG